MTNMALIKVKEVIGTSTAGFDAAFKNAIKEMVQCKKDITGAKIVSQSVDIKDNEIVEYKVNLKIAYRWDPNNK